MALRHPRSQAFGEPGRSELVDGCQQGGRLRCSECLELKRFKEARGQIGIVD
jgi:hypothetical protein